MRLETGITESKGCLKGFTFLAVTMIMTMVLSVRCQAVGGDGASDDISWQLSFGDATQICAVS